MTYPDFSKTLFLDIETVSHEKTFDTKTPRPNRFTTVPPSMQNLAKSSVFQWVSSTTNASA